jgi:hypothetical protein
VLGGDERWVDQFLAQHITIVYYFMIVFMYLINPEWHVGSFTIGIPKKNVSLKKDFKGQFWIFVYLTLLLL